ncbi:MAG: DNA-binding protein [Thermodesulfovibrionales bacterium]
MKFLTTIAMILVLNLVTGCSAEQFGSGVNKDIKKVKVKDVMIDSSLKGKTVNVEGIIVTQCQSRGCWFFLNDGTGQIFIDLATKGFSIPPKTGKKALVTGTIAEEQGVFKIIAHGVEIN